MKCGFAVSFSSHEVAPERSQPALNSRLEVAARCHGQVVYSVNTGGASKGIEALRGAVCGLLQLRRFSCSSSAAIPLFSSGCDRTGATSWLLKLTAKPHFIAGRRTAANCAA